jgi:hypothetical protein
MEEVCTVKIFCKKFFHEKCGHMISWFGSEKPRRENLTGQEMIDLFSELDENFLKLKFLPGIWPILIDKNSSKEIDEKRKYLVFIDYDVFLLFHKNTI